MRGRNEQKVKVKNQQKHRYFWEEELEKSKI